MAARIPKLKTWKITWTWTGATALVEAPSRIQAKLQGSQLVYGHPVRYGEFVAGLVRPTKEK